MTTALNHYTQENYGAVNRKLRYGKTDEAVPQMVEDLQRIRPFNSTSRSRTISQKFNCLGVPLSRTDNRSITLVIQSKTGRDISKFSQYPEEQEVLFLPLTGFEVVSVEKDTWEEYTIVLKEI